MPKERSSRLHAYTDGSGEPQALPLVRGFFADPNCGWSVGAYGAIAEFMRAKDDTAELTDLDEGGALVTARGALRVRLREGVRMVDAGHHGIACCLPASEAAMGRRGAIAELGPDADAIRPIDRAAVLFDIGVGAPHVDFCVRTDRPELIEVLRAVQGQNLFSPDNPAMGALLAASPDRVCVSRLARIEVFQRIAPPNGTTPDGPHTHLLPELITQGLAHDPAMPVPADLVPCLIIHPENKTR